MKKEKILINIEKLSDIEKYEKIGINNFLFAVNNYSIGYKSFGLEELENLKCKKYLLMNKVLNNTDIDKLKELTTKLEKFDGIIFEDIGLYNILKDYNIKLIWNQSHFATNYKSINYYLELTYSAVISNELTYNEINEIINKVNKPVILNVFGKNPVMYSRRTLLSNFNKYFNIELNKEVILDETISKNKFLAKEDNNGTFIFNNTYFNIINYLKELNDNNILFYLIYPNRLDYDNIIKVIDNESDIPYNDGFMNKKTIYKLGDKK